MSFFLRFSLFFFILLLLQLFRVLLLFGVGYRSLVAFCAHYMPFCLLVYALAGLAARLGGVVAFLILFVYFPLVKNIF
ncbi:hypothetical protein [Bartonella tamiae]|uniref:hypothetical protein n=1 Tax=Bartonella tamiae TaxID=373638 RepID=UPI0012DCC0D9|nr:hypothetical protein [Bartonella tamiae]